MLIDTKLSELPISNKKIALKMLSIRFGILYHFIPLSFCFRILKIFVFPFELILSSWNNDKLAIKLIVRTNKVYKTMNSCPPDALIIYVKVCPHYKDDSYVTELKAIMYRMCAVIWTKIKLDA